MVSNSLRKEITSALKNHESMNIGTYAELISKAPLNKEKEAKRQETRDVNWFKSIIRQRGKKHIKEVWAFPYGVSL